MPLDRRLTPLVLTDDERYALEGWARRRTTAQALALRARIVFAGRRRGGQYRDRPRT